MECLNFGVIDTLLKNLCLHCITYFVSETTETISFEQNFKNIGQRMNNRMVWIHLNQNNY